MSCDDQNTGSKPIPKNQVRSRNSIEQHEHEDQADARRVVLVDKCGEFIDSGNRLPVDAIVHLGSGADEPTIFNVNAALADTEYSQLLPDKTKHFMIKVRNNDAIMKLAFIAGDTSIKYVSVGYGNSYFIGDVEVTGMIIYFQTNKPGKVIEILTWS